MYRNVFSEIGISDADVRKRLQETAKTIFYGSDEESAKKLI